MNALANATTLALGTLTTLPVPAPTSVDRRVAGRAMVLAPLVGFLLAVMPVLLLRVDAPPSLVAGLAVASWVLLSGALHLDGLADTADGLGSRRPPEQALQIMRRSDIGPFGVAALVLTLVVQVAAVAALVDEPLTVAAALIASRATLPMVCTRWFPAARSDGLGAAVAGSVSEGWAAAVGVAVALGAVAVGAPYVYFGPLAGIMLAALCVRRLGGVTGDVYGAVVEVSLAVALVASALAN